MNKMNNQLPQGKQISGDPYSQKNSSGTLLDFSELNVGDKGFIEQCEGPHKHRLMVLGLTPGTQFSVVRVAPLGDPVEISFRGFSLTLRRDELNGIQVKKL